MFALATLAAVVIAVGVLATKGKIKLPQKLKNVVDTIRCNFNKPLNALPNKNIDIFQIIKENGMSLVDGKLSKADYKKLIMKYHPDRNLDNIEFATEILKKLKALKP